MSVSNGEALEQFLPNSHCSKLPKIIVELLENEQIYVDNLKQGIDNYIKVFDESPHLVPRELRGLRHHFFLNIEAIHQFHNEILLPRLRRVKTDLVEIAKVFIELVNAQEFYCYVLYALNSKRSESLCAKHIAFFNVRSLR